MLEVAPLEASAYIEPGKEIFKELVAVELDKEEADTFDEVE